MTRVSPGSPNGAGPPRRGRLLGKTFLSLRNRNFRLYFSGQIVSNTGNWLTNVALVLLVLKITGSGFAVGVLAACQFGPILLLSAWAGAVADRSDKRRLLLLTQSLEMAQSIGLAILAFMPHPPLGGLYALAVAGGILLAFDNPLRRSFVTEMVPAEDRPNAVVLYSVIVNVARIFGPALAGLLVVTVGLRLVFHDRRRLVPGRARLHRPHAHGRASPPAAQAAHAGVRCARVCAMCCRCPRSGSASSCWPSSRCCRTTSPSLCRCFVTDTLHRPSTVFTILYAVFGAGAVVCGLVVAHRSLVRLRHAVLGAFALGLAMLLLAFVPGVGLAVPAVFLVGMASILYLTATTAIVQVEARPEMHGRVLALQTVLFGGGTFIGGPILGWIADTMGGRAPLVLGAAVCLAAAAFGFLASRHYLAHAARSAARRRPSRFSYGFFEGRAFRREIPWP